MKRSGFILAAAVFILLPAALSARENEMEQLLVRLDSVLAQSSSFTIEKEAEIAGLRARRQSLYKPDDILWHNKMMYDEYVVYRADSAMVYAEANIDIARRLERPDLLYRWSLNKIFLLSAQGLMSEAEKAMRDIDKAQLPEDLMFQYYYTKVYLYSHLVQFSGNRSETTAMYHDIEMSLRREAMETISPGHPLYYSFAAFLHTSPDPSDTERGEIKARLEELVENSSLNTLLDALNAYSLAIMCQGEGDGYGYMKGLICSAISDIRYCNRDIASLEELSNVIYGYDDIDRGYAYIDYCMKAALQYPNRVRMVNISAVMDKFRQAYNERNSIQEKRIRTFFILTSILSAVLTIAVSVICIQFVKLSRSRRTLVKTNGELSELNEKLGMNNAQLFEANYVKEKYITYVFSLCSSYITKLEEYRKNIYRNLVVGRTAEIRKTVSDTSMSQNELKEFYRSFDAVFLQIYPDFVEHFNSLLRPEERIILKKGELLNTELRIYALVRLGINDSVKIAEFLHCSPQTVYNNRLKTRNKALVSKEDFEEKVRTSGKIQN